MRSTNGCPLLVALALALVPAAAGATTYEVGPGEIYEELSDLPILVPGDLVLLAGNHTYAPFAFWDNGASGDPVTIRGVRVNGHRPVISGGTNTIEAGGNHYVFEGLELTGGSFRCFFHHAHDIVLRDSLVRDCPQHGILGADNDSGSLLLEYVEVRGCGEGSQYHQIYMATDEVAHPGSVFRMWHCWVHSGNGGNGVKSRAERNEIYYNRIEGSYYHELELIGPDPDGAQDGWSEGLAREDADVVGNVLVKAGANSDFAVVRIGGDATGQSWGRYRFVNNSILVTSSSAAVFRIFDGLESLEAHNNVFARQGGGPVNLTRTVEAVWLEGEAIQGSHNWFPTDSTNVPADWTGSLTGANPGFVASPWDLFPTAPDGPLVDAGTLTTAVTGDQAFPDPLLLPLLHPPDVGQGDIAELGTEPQPRPGDGAIDIGAYEFGTGDTSADTDSGRDADSDSHSDTDTNSNTHSDTDSDSDLAPAAAVDAGCSCQTTGRRSASLLLLLIGGYSTHPGHTLRAFIFPTLSKVSGGDEDAQ